MPKCPNYIKWDKSTTTQKFIQLSVKWELYSVVNYSIIACTYYNQYLYILKKYKFIYKIYFALNPPILNILPFHQLYIPPHTIFVFSIFKAFLRQPFHHTGPLRLNFPPGLYVEPLRNKIYRVQSRVHHYTLFKFRCFYLYLWNKVACC